MRVLPVAILVVAASSGCASKQAGPPPARAATSSVRAPADHTKLRKGVPHKPGAKDAATNCTPCHGPELKGAEGPSCFGCHGKEWH